MRKRQRRTVAGRVRRTWRRRQARNIYETYPEVLALVHDAGVLLWTTRSVAWAGATVSDSCRIMQDAQLALRNAYNETMAPELRRDFDLGRIELNSTDYQGVFIFTFPLYMSLDAAEQAEVERELEASGFELASPSDLKAMY